MFTKIGKLLVSNIKNSVLYEFAVGLIGLLSDLVDPAQEISEMITETNALTRASETRAGNSDDVEDEVSDTEAEGTIETEPEVEEDVLSGAPAHEYE